MGSLYPIQLTPLQNFIAEQVTFPRIFIYSRNLVAFNAISIKQ